MTKQLMNAARKAGFFVSRGEIYTSKLEHLPITEDMRHFTKIILAENDQQLADSQKQIVMLRDAILRTCCNSEGVVCLRGSYDGRTILQEALAATEPKP